MNDSIKKGFGFGLTSGIITTLGLVIGLNSGTHSKTVVIGGILIIAIADAMSDALGVHISEEASNHHTVREVWQATISTFLTKLIIASTFIVPFLIFEISAAIIISIVWGFSMLVIFSYYIAKQQKHAPFSIIGEHLFIASIVIIATNYIGQLINVIFK